MTVILKSVNIRIVCLILSVLYFVSCNSNIADGGYVILNYNQNNTKDNIPEVLGSISFLALGSAEDELPGQVRRAEFENNFIFLGDFKQQKVFIYSEDGSLHGVLNKKGRGPGEYLHIQSFAVDKDYLYVMDSFSEKIIAYDLVDLSFYAEQKLPCMAWDFACLDNGGFIFAYAPSEGAPKVPMSKRYRLLATDAKMNVVSKYLPYEDGEEDLVINNCYLRSQRDVIVYHSYGSNTNLVFSKSDGSLVESYKWEFEGTSSTEVQIYSPSFYFDDKLLFEIIEEESTRAVLYDMDSKSYHENPGDGFYLFGAIGSDGKKLYAYWPGKVFYDAFKNHYEVRLDLETEKHISAELPYIVVYSR